MTKVASSLGCAASTAHYRCPSAIIRVTKLVHRRDFLIGGLGAILAACTASPRSLLSTGAHNPRVDRFVADTGFHGVIMRARSGETSYARAIGLADQALAIPTTLDSRYTIASISKFLTATLVLQYVDRGMLSLDTPISSYLPWYRTDTGGKVTLRHLLSNTSGIPNGYNIAAKADSSLRETPASAEVIARTYGQGDLTAPPGSIFDYSTTNWIIVVALLETVLKAPFPDIVRLSLLDPLALTHTHAGTTSDLVPAYSSLNPPVLQTETRLPFTAASGGFSSTAPDLVRAATQIFDGKVLSPAALRDLTTVTVPEQNYALGGRIRRIMVDGTERNAAWETGRAAGYRSLLVHVLETAETLVILNNTGLPQKTLDGFAFSLFA